MFLRLMMLLALAPIGVAAQATPAFTTVGAFVALSVPDLDASATWYAEKLGLQLPDALAQARPSIPIPPASTASCSPSLPGPLRRRSPGLGRTRPSRWPST